jgi:hypothetical protein
MEIVEIVGIEGRHDGQQTALSVNQSGEVCPCISNYQCRATFRTVSPMQVW